MYELLITKYNADQYLKNEAGDTPLMFAARCDSLEMGELALSLCKKTMWIYGPLQCVQYPLVNVEGARDDWKSPSRPKTMLQVIDEEGKSTLLYTSVIWQVINDKWKCYGKALFYYLLFFNSLALIFVTLAGCTALDTVQTEPDWKYVPTTDMVLVDGEFVMPPEENVSDSGMLDEPPYQTCEGVVVLWVIPIPFQMPAFMGDLSYAALLLINMYLLSWRLIVLRRLHKPLKPEAIEIISSLIPWLAVPLRFFPGTLPVHRTLLGISSGMGWLRFLLTAFKPSIQLGPLVLTVFEMFSRDIKPFVILYCCFFATVQTSLMGFFGAMRASKDIESVYTQANYLIEFTISPSTGLFAELQGTAWEELNSEDGVPAVVAVIWIVEALWLVISNIVLLNLLIAMMGNTYSVVLEESEAMWRLKLNELLLFLEASPSYFIPSFVCQRSARPRSSHFQGKLALPDRLGRPVEQDVWWLQMNIPFSLPPGPDPQEAKLSELQATVESLQTTMEAKFSELADLLRRGSPPANPEPEPLPKPAATVVPRSWSEWESEYAA